MNAGSLAFTRNARALIIGIVAVWTLSGLPHAASAATERYADPDYPWSLTWQGDDWTVPGPMGGLPAADLALAHEGGDSYVLFRAYDRLTDPAECIEAVPDFLSAGFPSASGRIDAEPIEDDDGDPVAFEDDSRSYVAVTFEFGGQEAAVGIDCRSLIEGEAVLMVMHITTLPAFDAERVDVEELLEGLDLPEGAQPSSRDRDSSSDGKIAGNAYVNAAAGYEVVWDEDLWEAEALESEFGGVFLTAGEPLFATAFIDAAPGYDGFSPAECADAYAGGLPDVGLFSDVEPADDLDLPDTDRDAEGLVFRYVYSYEDGEEADLVGYIECRPIDDDTMLRVFIQTFEQEYAEEIALIEELLDGIAVGGLGSTGGTSV